jgi:hypothetical protein
MTTNITVQGRVLTETNLAMIRQLIADHPDWSRYRLSCELAMLWQWQNAAGQLKDIACRTMMRKLAARGLIELPEKRCVSPNRFRHQAVASVACDMTAYHGELSGLQPLSVQVVNGTAEQELFASLLAEHHYLSYRQPVGENLQYLVRDANGRPVGCLLFGAAAWRCAARDKFIGWDDAARAKGLSSIVNNHRFLRLPWINAPHLASHVLGLVTRRLSADWQGRYGHAPLLLETFVDCSRFRGTCYRAANWMMVGKTTGRSRQDRYSKLSVPVKDILVYALTPSALAQLRGTVGQ